MGNVYSAQNVASYLIYELNESNEFVNNMSIQHLLSLVETRWQQAFGHTAFKEFVHTKEEAYTVKEVFETYAVHSGSHISLPATEYYLKYGTFQLVERTYAVPNFTQVEEKIVQAALAQYHYVRLTKAS
ncbi:hypothetical protein ACIQZG_13615 [Lysinibacillus sp. NPDC096418]|uniref:hypothetical protein n=1 Tax=Lysinibacillus sp. NPDC096418 TaxID=3364138 RepID=UPI00380D7A99